MSDQTPGDSRPPLNLALSIALVVLVLAGNGLLLFWPRPVVAPVVVKDLQGKDVKLAAPVAVSPPALRVSSGRS